MVKYLEDTEIKNLSGDAFTLLINIFDEKNTDIYTEKFVIKVQESLSYIDDDDTLNSLISILVCLVPIYELKSSDASDITKNPVLNDFVNKEVEGREELYREKVISITNKSGFYRMDKCCETINIILNKESMKNYYFNANDLNALIDILLREAQTNADSDTRAQIFKLIETIVQNKTWIDAGKEKID